MPHPRRTLTAVALSAVLLVAAGCSDDKKDDAATTTTTAAATTTTAGSAATASTPTSGTPTTEGTTATSAPATTEPAAPCTGGDGTIPDGATKREIIDVDGDGAPDTGWIESNGSGPGVTIGIATAAGGGTSTTWSSASPVTRSMLVVDADHKAPPEILLDDGRSVELRAFVDCEIVPVTNPEGQTYVFSLGFTDVGTGVGCVDGHLVGLDGKFGNGTTVSWTRTEIDLDGTHAKNGKVTSGTYDSAKEPAAVDLLREVTCYDATIANAGVTLPQ